MPGSIPDAKRKRLSSFSEVPTAHLLPAALPALPDELTEAELFQLLDEGLGLVQHVSRFQNSLDYDGPHAPPIDLHSDGCPCPGFSKCAFIVINPMDHCYVCSETGLSFGQVCVDDGSGSYRKSRNDITDEMSELPSIKRKRRDPVAASITAFVAAQSFGYNNSIPIHVANGRGTKATSNANLKNAPQKEEDVSLNEDETASTCKADASATAPVDSTHPSIDAAARPIPTSKAPFSRRAPRINQLIVDATAVLDEVIRVGHAMHMRHRRNLNDDPDETDKVLSLNASRATGGLEHLMIATVRRYIKDCQGRNEPPSLHDLHSICYMLRLQANQQQKSAKISILCAERRWWYIGVRDSIARLAVSLWTRMLDTPYMRDNRRSHDGFKQFVVGVAYGLRRGVKLSSGIVLIPRCERFCNALPNMRSPRDKRSKQTPFRMSAHRGMCTFQRAAASVAFNEQAIFWDETIRIARALELAHHSNVDN